MSWTLSHSGGVELVGASGTSALRPKERAVLAALCVDHPTPCDTDRIASLIWHPNVPATAHKSIQNHIARLRRAAPGVVETVGRRYRLSADVRISDGANGREFADLPDSPDVDAARRRLASAAAAALHTDVERRIAAGTDADVPIDLRRLLDVEPFDEHAWYLLALAEARLDRRRQALLTVQEARRTLVDVGLVPGDRLATLESRLAVGGTTDDLDPSPATRQVRCAPVLHPHRHDPFVGRAVELDALRRLWADATTTGRPQAAVIAGPAGIGKSRLADRFVEALTGDKPAPHVLDTRFRPDGGDGQQLIASSLLGSSSSSPAQPSDAPIDDFRIRLGQHLARVAGGPTCWFVDDLQWASDASLDLLRRLVSEHAGPLLLLATTRTVIGEPIAMTELRREVPTLQLEPAPLTEPEVADLLTTVRSASEQPSIVDELITRTAGLPLFVAEIARRSRLLQVAIDPSAVPTGIREWLRHHAASLSPRSRTVLDFAAVLESDIEPATVADGLSFDSDDARTACAELVAAGLLRTTPAAPAAAARTRYEFAHVLTRDVVYEAIAPERRAELHAAAAGLLDRRPGGRGGTHHADLCRHHRLAGPEHHSEAAHHACRAGALAFDVGAFDDARTWFSLACELDPDRLDAAVWLGRALASCGRLDEAREHLDDAIDRTQAAGDAVNLARATLALVGRAGRGASAQADDSRHITLLRRARAALRRVLEDEPDGHHHVLLSEVERELAFALLLTDHAEERIALLDCALQRMERLSPRRPRAYASARLGHRYARLQPTQLRERLDDLNEVLSMPVGEIGTENVLAALTYRHEEHLRLGRPPSTLDELERAEAILRHHPYPYWTWATTTWRVVDVVIAGRLDEAERTAAAALAGRSDVGGAFTCYGVNLTNIRLYQGRAEEMIDSICSAVDSYPNVPAFRAVLALCTAEAGDLEAAQEHLEWFADLDRLPHDTNRALGLACLAHVAVDLRQPRLAAKLLDELTPYDDQWIVISCFGGGGATWGPAAHATARLSALLHHDAATDRYRHAARAAAHAPLISDRIAAHASADGVALAS